MKTSRAIFDGGGGIILQLAEGYAHHYDDPEQAAEDWHLDHTETSGAAEWEGHEDWAAAIDPTADDIRNGAYLVLTAAEVTARLRCDDAIGWHNADSFLSAVRAQTT